MAEALGLPGVLDDRNRWAKKLGAETMDAGKLLDLMRPEVEKILILTGITSPPSQWVRVNECLGHLNRQYNALKDKEEEVMDSQLHFKQVIEVCKTISLLEDFKVVHRTVWILEGKPL